MDEDDEVLLKSTRILTEHFGYQPIAVIDDVINTINEIMYRCTEQLEQILINQTKNNKSSINREDSVTKIQEGTATLESYLEHTINTNFDKFEIYSLRNVFSIPKELINFIVLKHQENLNLNLKLSNDFKLDNLNNLDLQVSENIIKLIQEVKYQIELNKVLCGVIGRLKKLKIVSQAIKLKLSPLIANNGDNDRKILNELNPLNDTILFLVTQIKNIYDKINSIKDLIYDDLLLENFFSITNEEKQLNAKIDVIIDRINESKSNLKNNEDKVEDKDQGEDEDVNLIDFLRDGNVG